MYKIRDSVNDPLHEVYCHFDSDGAWTLVQSFSFANHTGNIQFRKPLSANQPVSENVVTWSGYRLSKARMESISQNSDQLRSTCAFEKEHDVNQTDYLQMLLHKDQLKQYITTTEQEKYILAPNYRGKINEIDLKGCKIKLHQNDNDGFHVHIDDGAGQRCTKPAAPTKCDKFHYFSYFPNCLLHTHRCTQNEMSTSQLWFGKKP